MQDLGHVVSCTYIAWPLFPVGYVLAGILYGSVRAGGVLLRIYRDNPYFKRQPFFLALVLLGTIVDLTAIIIMSRDILNNSNRSCEAWPWLLCVGHTMTTATIVATT